MPKKSKQQIDAEADVQGFKNELGPFVVAAETTRMAMVFADAKHPDNPITFANDSFLSLTGYARAEVLGQSFNFILAHAADAEALQKIDHQFLAASDAGAEIRYRRKDGSEFWAALFVSPVRLEDGEIVQYFASFVDLTALKVEQAHSRALIDELNHRVKNTLAMVQSIVWQATRTATDPSVIREAIESRLMALSRSHDLLTRANWEGAGLVDLLHDALEPFRVDGRADRIAIEGENIRFPPESALALGISFNELATNAVKYGALSNSTGSIHVGWKLESTGQGRRLVLQWREKCGPPVSPSLRKGFGSRVIEHGLDAFGATVELDFRPAGLLCTMSIPVPEGAPHE
ncbi:MULTISPECIES: HWE histidine kinase domain-containing protein [Filomicrobium]|uniref:Blue-light-activated histidine kinase n=1 Tax=Filomicrobium insigne TaxID=418854 RepID=A0A1H0SHS6_9HYPH|nr:MULTISPECIES: HWE histidine kinase domain-containing protein [Filomicrobium]SDP41089.1 PAS domain S-box-containing protein [Filomicrobium insigne]